MGAIHTVFPARQRGSKPGDECRGIDAAAGRLCGEVPAGPAGLRRRGGQGLGARHRRGPRRLLRHLRARVGERMAGIGRARAGQRGRSAGHRAPRQRVQDAALADLARQEPRLRRQRAAHAGHDRARPRPDEPHPRARCRARVLRARAGRRLLRPVRAPAAREGAAVDVRARQRLGLGDRQRARSRHRLHALWPARAQPVRPRGGAAGRRPDAHRHGRDAGQSQLARVPAQLRPGLDPDVHAVEPGCRHQGGRVAAASARELAAAHLGHPERRGHRLGRRHHRAAQDRRRDRPERIHPLLARQDRAQGAAQGLLGQAQRDPGKPRAGAAQGTQARLLAGAGAPVRRRGAQSRPGRGRQAGLRAAPGRATA